jgi:hypothetical protein
MMRVFYQYSAYSNSYLTRTTEQNQSTFGGNANIPNQQQEMQTWQQLALIKAKWDTKSPLCYFKVAILSSGVCIVNFNISV